MTNLDYNAFSEQCVDELKTLQANLHTDYNLDWYDNWFYDQSTGLITFSTGLQEINFKFESVGSFSEKSSTWRWSWDDEPVVDGIKNMADVVKKFGEQFSFSKLVEGYFESSEIEAWELASIAVKLMGGIGVYRPVGDDGLKIFLVLTEKISEEAATKIKDKYTQCDKHESGRAAFVCQHLNTTTVVGFEEAFETYEHMYLEDEDDLQAWCDACEIERQKEDGWNEVSMAFAGIKIVCEKCYFEIKSFNLREV